MELSAIQSAVAALVVALGSVAAAFGLVNGETAQIAVSAAGTIIAAVFTIVVQLEGKTAATKAVALAQLESPATARRKLG